MFNLNSVLYGNPAGRKLYFFEPEPGSNVPANSYADEELTIPHTHPVIADVNGVFPPIYIDQTKRVAVRLFDSRDRVIFTHTDARQLCGPFIRCHECGAAVRGLPIA
jgi:hypothetical protein